MGSNNSQVDDAQPLINSGDGFTDAPLINELELVIIGSHCSGKNTVGNFILGHNHIKWWTKVSKRHWKKTGQLSERTIKLVRVRGWTGDLSASVNKQKQTKQQLVYSVQSHFDTGPHAILFVLDVNSTITETTRKSLEGLLSEEIWDHTIMIFTHGEKLQDCTIKDKIVVNQLAGLIERCGRRYHVIHKNMDQRGKFIETLEYFIADKNAPVQFCFSDKEREQNNDLAQKKSLIERIKNKITLFKNCEELITSKDAEIKRLENILHKREEDVRNLERHLNLKQSLNLKTKLSINGTADDKQNLIEEIKRQKNIENKEEDYQKLESQPTQLQNELSLSSRCVECERKDEEIRRLRELCLFLKDACHFHLEMPMEKSYARMQSPGRSQLSKVKNIWSSQPNKLSLNSVELQQFSPSRPDNELHSDKLYEWPLILIEILEELDESQFNKMKDFLRYRKEWKIPECSLDGKDRNSLAKILVEKWCEQQCIINIKNIMKAIPRQDNNMKKLIMPHLEAIGESW